MIEIQMSPELSYVLSIVWLFAMFLLFASEVTWMYRDARGRHWRRCCFWIVVLFVQVYNVIEATHRTSMWFSILAELRGW